MRFVDRTKAEDVPMVIRKLFGCIATEDPQAIHEVASNAKGVKMTSSKRIQVFNAENPTGAAPNSTRQGSVRPANL